MGRNHARIYSQLENANLVAVSDVNGRIARQVSLEFKTKGYTDYREMLDKERIDVVSVVVPGSLHKEVAIDVINKGISVLVEKPIATDIDGARAIVDAAKEKNVKLMVGHVERFNPAIIELKRCLENNKLGDIFKIIVARIGPFPTRIIDMGVIRDLSLHDIDIINYLIGLKPKRIYAETHQLLNQKYYDSLTALMRYESDISVMLNISYLSPKKIRELYVFGEKGMLKVNYITQELIFYGNPSYDSKEHPSRAFKGVSEGKEVLMNVEKKSLC
uniref:UDP-N-acetylglucosamine 3-dehydrogenase n=1 Tax=Candidatus Kentrum sp. FW TaxID=2126338 RepID=A0A450TBD0_9GAMM|nr:MAG: UDP-N-acetylglucosamine 3-dehydrogenase [Candidatus Kentron sp. FW]